MIAFAFSFPGGRYHATPWGRHANEADIAWPPESVRILRALCATWWRKADQDEFSGALLEDLIDTLAAEPPVFRLPDAVHTHVRAFMPAPSDRKLVYDAFLRFSRGAELIVAWAGVSLTQRQNQLCAHLLARLGYLGRAESWVEARVADDWDGEVNARPRSHGELAPAETVPVDIAVPLTPGAWAELRGRFTDGMKTMTTVKRAAMEVTLPERLSAALTVDTSDWQKAGWSSPPPIRHVVYDRPSVGPVPSVPPRRVVVRKESPDTPEVARFVLAGRPAPRVQDAIRIGEIARWALMSGHGIPPPEISGRDANGPLRDDATHAHAFFLPEDADNDGLIDHLVVYCRRGFSREARRRLDRLTRLWRERGRGRVDDDARGRQEWRVALEGIAAPEEFAEESPLLRRSRVWTSMTPYLLPWHAKRNFGVVEQIVKEVALRCVGSRLSDVATIDERGKRAHKFHRVRSRSGLSQPDRFGRFLKLTFENDIRGPVALGFAAHYGLGLFVPAD